MGKGKIIKAIAESTISIATNKDVQKMVLGTYADGTTRSMKDAIDGEILSPSQKKKLKKKNKKKKNKKRKIKL